MKPTLLVLAAGMGSRFGGLKQMAPVGPSGEWILDYSVYDAIRAGFGKVVFVIREKMKEGFTQSVLSKFAGKIDTALAFQNLDDLPDSCTGSADRSKPWGTGHAVYAARHDIDAPFAVINADDFYGQDAYRELSSFLCREGSSTGVRTYALVGYKLANTLSHYGSVSRGICRSGNGATLKEVEEHTEIQREADGRISGKDSRNETVTLKDTDLVSLNCWGFPASFIDSLEPLLAAFLNERGQDPQSEFYLPFAVDALNKAGQSKSEILKCDSDWIGITHRDDLSIAQEKIADLCTAGEYPKQLWS